MEKLIALRIMLKRDLRDKFKAMSALRGTNMRVVILEMIRKYLTSEGRI